MFVSQKKSDEHLIVLLISDVNVRKRLLRAREREKVNSIHHDRVELKLNEMLVLAFIIKGEECLLKFCWLDSFVGPLGSLELMSQNSHHSYQQSLLQCANKEQVFVMFQLLPPTPGIFQSFFVLQLSRGISTFCD